MESPRLTHAEMVEGLERLIFSKSDWIATFSTGTKKRPDHEIETQKQHLRVLEQAAADYRRAAARGDSNGRDNAYSSRSD